jgi:membrane protein implicated in regulation of membrane protease activity
MTQTDGRQYRPVTHPTVQDSTRGHVMRKRTRKLIGTAAILLVVIVYGPLAMALADSRIALAPQPLQVVAFVVLGLVWILPLMPLIRWMEKPDQEGR